MCCSGSGGGGGGGCNELVLVYRQWPSQCEFCEENLNPPTQFPPQEFYLEASGSRV